MLYYVLRESRVGTGRVIMGVTFNTNLQMTTTKQQQQQVTRVKSLSLYHSCFIQIPEMSLSFVKSAVLSSTDGVSHNEEVTVDSSETEALRRRGETKSLFAQLQENKDSEMEEEEERKRAMRESMSLNVEDCAHLNAIDIARREKELAKRKLEEEELAVFRAAKTYREISKESSSLNQNQVERFVIEVKEDTQSSKLLEKQVSVTPFVPLILGKRKKKIVSNISSSDPATSKDKTERQNSNDLESDLTKKLKTATEESFSEDDGEGLGTLLGGYGSDSDSE